MQNNLSEQEMKFCELYAGGKAAVRAYAEAYGFENLGKWKEDPRYDQCATGGSRLLKKPAIHDMVVQMQQDVYDSMCINAERIAAKLAEQAFADRDDEFYTPTIQQKALDMLQKQLGLQKQQIKQEVEQTTVIRVEVDEE